MVKCSQCGTDLGPAEKVCPVCGTPRSSKGKRTIEEELTLMDIVEGKVKSVLDQVELEHIELIILKDRKKYKVSIDAPYGLTCSIEEEKVKESTPNPQLETVKETVSFPSIRELVKVGAT